MKEIKPNLSWDHYQMNWRGEIKDGQGVEAKLTPLQTGVMYVLFQHPGEVVPQSTLGQEAWHMTEEGWYREYPIRIQRKRTKGWRMPPNTVYVGRPTKWGNPFREGDTEINPIFDGGILHGLMRTRANAVEQYKLRALWKRYEIKKELRGKNLACWCPLDQSCHADILLEIANKEDK